MLSRARPCSIPGAGRTTSHALGHGARDGACEKRATGCPARGGSSPAPGGTRIPGRGCLKSLPPSLPPWRGTSPAELRMLQAPADEPEESCGKVKASGEAARSSRESPQPAPPQPGGVTSSTVSDRAGRAGGSGDLPAGSV